MESERDPLWSDGLAHFLPKLLNVDNCACQKVERVRRAKATRRCPVRNTAVNRSIAGGNDVEDGVGPHFSLSAPARTCPNLIQ